MSEIHVLAARFNESDCLVTATEEEDIWIWNNGEEWGNELPTLIIIIISLPHFHIVPVVHQRDPIIFLSYCVSLLMQPTLSSYFRFIFANFLSY